MNNKKALVFILLLFFISTLITNKMAIDHQNKIIYEENIKLIQYVIKTHPELKSELINEWLNNDKVVEDETYLEGIEKLKEYKTLNYILKINFIIISILFILIFNIFKKQEKRTKTEIKKITEYINRIINNEYYIDFKEYNNNELSILKNDIGKIVIKLIENNENEQKQKLILKDFLSNVSHQIKTPLTSLFVTNDILKSEIKDKNLLKFIEEEDRQLERINWLIQNLLKMSLLDSNNIDFKKENIEIKDLIDETLSLTKFENIKLIKKINNYEIIIDKKWTTEAILNILNNAIRHTKDQIIIETGETYFYKYIKITDNGNGINEEMIKKIFERFFSNSKNGVGIGLNISKEIIEKQNGTIEVKSSDVTTFEIKFY